MVPLVAGSSADLLAGCSVAFVDLELEALGLSSSEKLFFNHLDGKHMAGIESEGEEGEEWGSRKLGRVVASLLWPLHFISREHLRVRENS